MKEARGAQRPAFLAAGGLKSGVRTHREGRDDGRAVSGGGGPCDWSHPRVSLAGRGVGTEPRENPLAHILAGEAAGECGPGGISANRETSHLVAPWRVTTGNWLLVSNLPSRFFPPTE